MTTVVRTIHIVRRNRRKRVVLVLNALLLPMGQHVQPVARFVEEKSVEAEGCLAAWPIPLLGNLHAPVKHLRTELLAVLCSPEAFELDVHRVERIVRPWHSQRGVDDLFAVLLALGAVRRGQVDVLESPPAAHVEAEHEVEVSALLDPVLHQVVEAVAPFRRQAGLPAIGKLVDDVDPVVSGPLLYELLLDRDRILLPIPCGVPVVGDATKSWRGGRLGRFHFGPPRGLTRVTHHILAHCLPSPASPRGTPRRRCRS